MNKFVIFSILIFLFPIAVGTFFQTTSINDLKLDTNVQIYAGEGEVCITPYSKIECNPGLECILLSTTPQVNGKCLKPGTKLEEDLVYRSENFKKNKTLTSDYVEYRLE